MRQTPRTLRLAFVIIFSAAGAAIAVGLPTIIDLQAMFE